MEETIHRSVVQHMSQHRLKVLTHTGARMCPCMLIVSTVTTSSTLGISSLKQSNDQRQKRMATV